MTGPERAHPRQALADFDLGAKLGESPAAEVFRARNRTFEVVVALKRWRRPFPPYAQRALADTCRLHWELSDHPNIVRLYWAGPADDPPWTATELRQRALADLLAHGAVPAADAWRIATDVVRGLAALHHRRRAHGALKPSNILVSDGRAVLCDLAFARGQVPAPAATAPSLAADLAAAAALMRELFPDMPPVPPPETADELLAVLESARARASTLPENAGPFRVAPPGRATPRHEAPSDGRARPPGAGGQNAGAYAPRSAEAGDLPANLHTPAPASRRDNAATYPEKPGAGGGGGFAPEGGAPPSGPSARSGSSAPAGSTTPAAAESESIARQNVRSGESRAGAVTDGGPTARQNVRSREPGRSASGARRRRLAGFTVGGLAVAAAVVAVIAYARSVDAPSPPGGSSPPSGPAPSVVPSSPGP